MSVSATPRECRIPDDSESSALGVAQPLGVKGVSEPLILKLISLGWSVALAIVGVVESADGAFISQFLAVSSETIRCETDAEPARVATRANWSSLVRSDPSGLIPVVDIPAVSFQSLLDGVGHPNCSPVASLADVRCADARSRNICRPAGVTCVFEVSEYSIEPDWLNRFVSVSFSRLCSRSENCRAGDLLSEDEWRLAFTDESEEHGPEVSLIFGSFAFSGDGEGLTWTGAGADCCIVRYPGKSKGQGPAGDSCEKVTLCVSDEFM